MSLPAPIQPIVNDDLLLSDAIEFNMKNNPNQPYFVFTHPHEGTQVVTNLEFGRAANRAAHLLRPNSTGSDGEVVAIIAHTDTILYQTIVTGLILAGLVPFPISPRNTPEAVAELLQKTSCHRLLATNVALKPLIDVTKDSLTELSHEVQISEIPSLALVYPQLAHEVADHPFEYYPPPRRPSMLDTCIILHSSGSTRNPKAIFQTHLSWIHLILSPEMRVYNPRLVLGSMGLPPFHAFGIAMHIFFPTYGVLATAVFPPTLVPGGSPVQPSPQSVLEHCKSTKANALFTAPAFIQAWSTMPQAIDFLKELEFLGYGGGPLPPKIGNQLASAGVRINPIYGATEFGSPSHLVPAKGSDYMDWEYLRFFEHTNVRWAPLDENNDMFELQLLACKTYRPLISNLPDVDGYATADVFKPHPTKEGLWKIIGRLDDVIIHSSGEKTVPGPMEVIIMSNPLVQGAVIFGRGRDQTGILIEFQPGSVVDVRDKDKLASLRNQLWPTIEEANNVAPAFSKIFKEMILFTLPEKPLPRAGKGTVRRQAALDLYESECSALYENVESNVTEYSRPISWATVDVERWILQEATELTSGTCTSTDINLFDQGFDSLSATILRVRITYTMRSSEDQSVKRASRNLDQNLVYNAPTIKQLSAYITSSIQSGPASQPLHGAEVIEELVKKYTKDIGLLNTVSPPTLKVATTVLLTGSTGHIGSHILANLLKIDHIVKVYAFNRSSPTTRSLLDRHIDRFRDVGIDPQLLESKKLVLITGDATRSDLGIDKELYVEISSSVDIVIHNAWKLDFNMPLASYEPNIKSSRHFIDLIQASPNASYVRFLFVSSVASAQSWDNSRGLVPENIIEASSALGGGYGEGKYVVERILANSGLQATAIRLGQVCGGHKKGSWPTTDWFPILVKSSITLGVFPGLDGIVSWLPVDSAASAILDLALLPLSTPLPPVVNLVHPRPVEQKTINDGICSAIKDVLGLDLPVVPFNQWLSTIEAHAEKPTLNTLASIPAVKLIGGFLRSIEGQVFKEFSMEQMLRISSALHPGQLRQIGDGDTKLWVEYWKGVGYL